MRYRLAVLPALVALCPSVASAAVLSVHVGTMQVLSVEDRTVVLDVFVRDTGSGNEQLNTFTVRVNGLNFSQTGVRFLPPPRLPTDEHPYVFKDFPDAALEDFNSTYARMQVGAVLRGQNDEVDVPAAGGGAGLFSVPVHIPEHAVPGIYSVLVDITATQFAGRGDEIITIVGQPGIITFFPGPVFPEPSAAALLLGPAVAPLRRPRPHRA